MPKATLTDPFVKKTKPPATGRVDYSDLAFPGFRFRITENGVRSFSMITRLNGNQIRIGLGRYPVMTLADARTKAREALQMVARGEDPRTERRMVRSRKAETFEDVAAEFLKRHGRNLRPRSLVEVARPIRKLLVPCWGKRSVADITRRDIYELVDDIMDAGTPIAANRTLAVVKTFFNWCVERGILEASPAAAVKRPAQETARDHVLTDDEITKLWPVFDEQGYPFGTFQKMLLITGQRRGEAAAMRWADLDLDAAVWHLPGEATKSGRSHDVPLAAVALEVLTSLPRFSGGEYVFSTTAGKRPISGMSRAKARTDQASGVTGWRLHDLRRTVGTRMTQLRVPVFVVGRVLNHSPHSAVGITSVYDRYSYESEKRHALETWARKLTSIVRPTPDKVVPLRG